MRTPIAPSRPRSRQSRPTSDPSSVYSVKANSSENSLSLRIQDVRLSTEEASFRDQKTELGDQIIRRDISQEEFDQRADSNSIAASRGMRFVPSCIQQAAQEKTLTQSQYTEQSRIERLRDPAGSFAQASQSPQARSDLRPFHQPQYWTNKDPLATRYHQPKFLPSTRHEQMVARERLKPPAFGGKSKKDQLGSVNDSWGELGVQGPKVYGMFEIEEDPPSRSTSPFKEVECEEGQDEAEERRPTRGQIRDARNEALGHARKGTVYEHRTNMGDSNICKMPMDSSQYTSSHNVHHRDQGGPSDERADGIDTFRTPAYQRPSYRSRGNNKETPSLSPMPQPSPYSRSDVFGPKRSAGV